MVKSRVCPLIRMIGRAPKSIQMPSGTIYSTMDERRAIDNDELEEFASMTRSYAGGSWRPTTEPGKLGFFFPELKSAMVMDFGYAVTNTHRVAYFKEHDLLKGEHLSSRYFQKKGYLWCPQLESEWPDSWVRLGVCLGGVGDYAEWMAECLGELLRARELIRSTVKRTPYRKVLVENIEARLHWHHGGFLEARRMLA
jgi:hypothetical protein